VSQSAYEPHIMTQIACSFLHPDKHTKKYLWSSSQTPKQFPASAGRES